jgi:hypothetical protein
MGSDYHKDLVTARELKDRVLKAIMVHGYSLDPMPDRSLPGEELYRIREDVMGAPERELIITETERGIITSIQLFGSKEDITYFGKLAYNLREVRLMQLREEKPSFSINMPFSWDDLAKRTPRTNAKSAPANTLEERTRA